MSQSIFHVRPLDTGKGWAIDEYDGRGAWQSTYRNNAKGEPLDKQDAQRRVFQLRRKAVNSAPKDGPVNKTNEPSNAQYIAREYIEAHYGYGPPQETVDELAGILERFAAGAGPLQMEPLKDITGCDV